MTGRIILNMLDWLGFGSFYHQLVETLFLWALARVSVNGVLFDPIILQWIIRQGCSIAPYLYVISTNSLGYLLDVVRV